MNKFEKIYEQIIPSNVIVDKDSIIKCMEMAYEMGVDESKQKYDNMKNSYESIIEDLIDDRRCPTVKMISSYNKSKLLINL
jgi:hypothetical protein